MNSLELLPISGIPEVRPGDDLGALVADAALASIGFEDGVFEQAAMCAELIVVLLERGPCTCD